MIISFSIFDPLFIPENDTEGFKMYGVNDVKILGTHFHKRDEGATTREQLLKEWSSMKNHLKDVVKPKVPTDIKEGKGNLPVQNGACFIQANIHIFFQANIHSRSSSFAPSHLCLARKGASALKNIKTKHRNMMKNDKLEAPL